MNLAAHRLRQSRIIDPELFEHVSFGMEKLVDLYGQMLIDLKLTVYGKDHGPPEIIRYPADWWQALKERFAPAWFRDRYPVKFTEHTISLREFYPHIRPFREDAVMSIYKHTLETSCYDW